MSIRPSSEYSNSLTEKSKKEKVFSKDEMKTARKRVYSLLFSDKLAIIAIFPAILAGLAPILTYQFIGNIITETAKYKLGEIDDPMPGTKRQVLSLVISLIFISIAFFFATFLWTRVGARIAVRIRDEIFSHMMTYDVTFFDTHSIGSLLTILGEDATTIQESFGSTKNAQIQSIAQFVIVFLFIYIQSWRLGLVMTTSIPVILITMLAVQLFLNNNAGNRFKHVFESITVAEETLSNARTVRSFNREDGEVKRFGDQTRKSQTFDRKFFMNIGYEFGLIFLIIYGYSAGVLYYGATFVGERENGRPFSSGSLLAVFGFTFAATWALISFQFMIGEESRAIQSAARVLDLINYKPNVNFDGGLTYDDFQGHIKFDHVSFVYPTRKTYALNDVSFEVKPGQSVAFVGHSGSGKSTTIQLIERYYDATDGNIFIDGHNIKEIDPRWLHRQMSLVSQEPILFQGTIRDNVLYGVQGNHSDDEIMTALEKANAKKFVTKFSDGLDHLVGDRGSVLSGGQRQRIAIARAVMKNPKILITDEATSALDSESEKKVQDALDKVLKERTGIAVAHRLSTVIGCDVIFVLDTGKIVEVGTHEELIAKGGTYYNLVKRQLKKKTEDSKTSSDSDHKQQNEEKSEPKSDKNKEEKSEVKSDEMKKDEGKEMKDEKEKVEDNKDDEYSYDSESYLYSTSSGSK